MTKIHNFINAGGTYNDNSESVITISPEGTKVEQHLHPQEKPVANDNSVCIESPVYLSDEKGAKIDIIRVLNVLYELGMFHGKNGAKLLKKDFFTAMGKAINKDLSNYDKDLSRSTSDSTALEKHLRIFVDMKKKMEEIWNSK